MKKILLLLVLVLGVDAFGQSAFVKAEQLLSSNKYQKAQTSFLVLHKEDPTNLKVIQKLGEIEGYYENYEKAAEWFKLLVEAQPKNAEYNFKYGGALGLLAKESSKFKALGLLDDVKEHLQKAADLDKNHIQSRYALSQMYCELPGIVGGSIDKSKAYADELLKISPVDGYYAHGFIYEYEEEYANAEKMYARAIEVGGSITSYRKLANLYERKMKDGNAALKILEKAATKFPNDQALSSDISRLSS
jgi:tetratricopeptide (TPR) repeat protein